MGLRVFHLLFTFQQIAKESFQGYKYQKYQIMSRLIDQNDEFLHFRHGVGLVPTLEVKPQPNPLKDAAQEEEKAQIRVLKEDCQTFQCNQNDEILGLTFTHNNKLAGFTILQKLTYRKIEKTWKSHIELMSSPYHYLKIYQANRVLHLFKEFSRLSNRQPNFFARLSISPLTAVIRIDPTQFLFMSKHEKNMVPKTLSTQLKTILTSSIRLIATHHDTITKILELNEHPQPLTAKNAEVLHRVSKYMKKYGVFLSISGNQEPQTRMAVNEQIQKESVSKIMQRYMQLDVLLNPVVMQLYLPFKQKWPSPPHFNDLAFSSQDKGQIKKIIRIPKPDPCSNKYQNNYILNCIKIKNYQKGPPVLGLTGGFSNISWSNVDYWYVYSGFHDQVVAKMDDQAFTDEKLIRRKLMVIKWEKKEEQDTIKSKIRFEKEILKQIKGGQAFYLNKYYLSTDEGELKDCLLSDFFSPFDLSRFVGLYGVSLSLCSKIQILCKLALGIRYLKMFGVVHLDLKPNNIMISEKSRMVKLIDFGESFHPRICLANHAPGISVPYSSPQNYTPSTSFSEKSDIFSFGMIAHELLFGCFPFYRERNVLDFFRKKEYVKHWFYCPEKMAADGDGVMFPLLPLVIGRCLDPDPEKRPQLDWLCLMMRVIYEFYA